MRKIVSKQEEAKRQKRNQLIVGVVMIFLLFFSVLGYSFQGRVTTTGNSDTGETITYNGLEFTEQNNFWIVDNGNVRFAFSYNPEETNSINTNVDSWEKYQNKPLYIYSENKEAESEISRNLYGFVNKIEKACPEGQECGNQSGGEKMPVKTCEDNFIIIEESENENIKQQNNCVYITGNEENLIKTTDEFLFKIFGIK